MVKLVLEVSAFEDADSPRKYLYNVLNSRGPLTYPEYVEGEMAINGLESAKVL